MCWEPPHGAARASGGLLGVIGGEAWRGSRGGFEHGGPVSAALLDLCRAYVTQPGEGPPVEVAERHEGVPGPGWLLPVAFMRPDPAERQRDVRDLAAAAGMGSYALPACVAYVEVAAHLFAAEGIVTTVSRAKLLRPLAESLITKAKKGGLHQKRQVMAVITDRDVAAKLFDEIGPRYADRPGGYTRILKLGPRPGDNAPMARIELV